MPAPSNGQLITTSPASLTAPDLVVPVVGYRQWRLAGGYLQSLFTRVHWPGPELSASCLATNHEPWRVPAKECVCGIYAYYDPCPLLASAGIFDFVSGAVILWGVIELHDSGMRASHARVVSLELPLTRGRKRKEIQAVARRLGVPAVPHRQLRASAMRHGLELQPELRGPAADGGLPARHPAGRRARRLTN